jgi:hypothetical protein
VLILTSYSHPLLSAARLQHLVATKQVRYALLHRGACKRCAGVMRWARTHARDVSAAAGEPRGTLFRFTTTRHLAKAA